MRSLIFCWLIVFGHTLTAQIVNIEDKRADPLDSVGWQGQFDGGFTLVDNGRRVLTLNARATLQAQRYEHTWLSFSDFGLVRAADQDFVNQGFQHFRYNYDWAERWTYEAFTQVQFNERLLIGLRALLGTGVRHQLLQTQEEKGLFVGLAYMYEYDEVAERTIFHRDHRLSSYVSFQVKPTPTLRLAGTTYYQPLLTDFGTFRVSTRTQAALTITQKLSFTTSIDLTYDARLREDAPTVPATIYKWVNGLRYRFN